jgi:hypothetical protein
MTHLIEGGARTYIHDVIARCGARVDRDEVRWQDRIGAVTDCPQCLALEAEDDAAIAALLSEKTQTRRKPEPEDDGDRDDSDRDEAEIEAGFGDDEDADGEDDPDAVGQSER